MKSSIVARKDNLVSELLRQGYMSDVASYVADAEYSDITMIPYITPEMNLKQVEQIRLGLEAGVDVSTYADPKLDAEKMCACRVCQMS